VTISAGYFFNKGLATIFALDRKKAAAKIIMSPILGYIV
jgi:hypothetical protein